MISVFFKYQIKSHDFYKYGQPSQLGVVPLATERSKTNNNTFGAVNPIISF